MLSKWCIKKKRKKKEKKKKDKRKKKKRSGEKGKKCHDVQAEVTLRSEPKKS